MTEVFAGIDGGGTKSFMRIVDADDGVIWEGKGGSTNLCSNSEERVRENLRLLFEEAGTGRELKYLSICLGTAGILYPNSNEVLSRMLTEITGSGRVKVVGDMETPLEAAAFGQDALVIIAGTGSICYGRNMTGQTARSGGWGHIFGDEGSGYWLVCRGLSAVCSAYDGRGPDTCLTELFMERYKTESVAELLAMPYQGTFNKYKLAANSDIIDKAAARGDAAALAIIKEAAVHLTNMAGAVLKRISADEQAAILLYGGVALSPLVRGELTAQLNANFPKALVRLIDRDAAWGAIEIAKRIYE